MLPEFIQITQRGTDVTIAELNQMPEEIWTSSGDFEVQLQNQTEAFGVEIIQEQAEKILRESEERLRFLTSQLLMDQEEERKKNANEIHDTFAVNLAAIKFKIEKTVIQMEEGVVSTKLLKDSISTIQQIIKEARRMMTGLRPSELDDLGIGAALNGLCREFQDNYPWISVEKEIDSMEDPVPEPLRTVIFRVSQEALNNIAKHSNASRVNLYLKRRGTLDLTVRDNGHGFDPEEELSGVRSRRGIGLIKMIEWVDLSRGALTIRSSIGKGERCSSIVAD